MSMMSGQFRLDSRNLCDRIFGWTGIGGIKKESSFSHYTGWGEKRTKAVWSTTRSRLSLAETLSLYQSKKGRIVPSMSSLNRVHLGNFLLFLIEYQTYHTTI
ncbi:hypothetical protein P8452_24622 [Trifolium repens]|nr:hypothetical protein P8452_24622 [Trifolium repens]